MYGKRYAGPCIKGTYAKNGICPNRLTYIKKKIPLSNPKVRFGPILLFFQAWNFLPYLSIE